MSSATPNSPAASQPNPAAKGSVFANVTPYHWVVFLVAASGWLFDCMGQRIFTLSRQPAMRELLGPLATSDDITHAFTKATTVMMIGWATGGIIFGTMSDKWGRVKTIVATLLAYSVFSGLTGLAHTENEFLIYRFLGGLGIGGMFGAATTLLAESVPTRVRPLAMGAMQALSAIGNMCGSFLSGVIPPGKTDFYHGYAGWRFIFFVGTIPAVLALVIPFVVHEPVAWVEAKRHARESGDASKRVGSLSDMFSNPLWRKHAIIGVCLGLAGMAGLWGIGFFSPELITTALAGQPLDIVNKVKSQATAIQDVGSFFGMLTFTWAATYLGRKKAFAGAFVLSLIATIFVFQSLRTPSDAYWMLPIMGFAQLSVFGGYSIYFPELFPTRLRGTGISFCYNAVRYLAATFPLMLAQLNSVFKAHGDKDAFRTSATILSFIYLLGLIALFWAPETKGKPLPEG